MNPDDYCQNKTAPSGSTHYYATLFLPASQRAAVTAILALDTELSDIAVQASDPSVARIKLTWWRTQLQTFLTQQAHAPTAEHPVCQALMPCRQMLVDAEPCFDAMAQAVDIDLEQTRYLDWPSLQRYCEAGGGARTELMALACGVTEAPGRAAARTLGTGLRLAELLARIGENAQMGRVYVPIDDLQQFGVKAADILNGRYSESFVALMRAQANRALTLMREAVSDLPKPVRRALRPSLILALAACRLLEEAEHEHWQILHQRVALTPLRKFWLAWRTWNSGGNYAVRHLLRARIKAK